MSIWEHTELLCRRISEEAATESEAILSEAQDEVDRLIGEAKERAARDREARFQAEKAKAYAEARRMTDSMDLQVKRKIMGFQEQVIQEVLRALEARAQEWRRTPAYVDFLVTAVEESVTQLPGKEFVVELNGEDLERVEEFMDRLAEIHSVQLHLRASDAVEGGARITTMDGRVRTDHTTTGRIRNAEDMIRQEIWRRLVGSRQDNRI